MFWLNNFNYKLLSRGLFLLLQGGAEKKPSLLDQTTSNQSTRESLGQVKNTSV